MYEVITPDEVREHVEALPRDVVAASLQAFEVMELVPWNGDPYRADYPDRPMRTLRFGSGGLGLVTYLILERDQIVEIISVVWAG